MLAYLIPLGDVLIGKVGYCLRCHAKIWGTVNVPHGQHDVEYHQLCVPGVILGDEEVNGWYVLHPQPQPHIGIRQVYLAKLDWN